MRDPILDMLLGDKDLGFIKDAYIKANEKDITHDPKVANLCHWEELVKLYVKLVSRTMEIEIPYEDAIPKDDGTDRIVLIGGHEERFLCPAIARAINRLLPELTHHCCKSYQEGIGTGIPVLECSKAVMKVKGNDVGGKYDFHHYFDTILKEVVFYFFDLIEQKLKEKMKANGEEVTDEHFPSIDYLRQIYSNDKVKDIDKNIITRWSGIRQGNAISTVLANMILYELDDFMSKKYSYYVRYSDDLIVVTSNVDEATNDILNIVTKYGVELNLKKTEKLKKDRYFKFLGFSIRGDSITISKGRLHDFVIEIRKCCHYKHTYKQALRMVERYLYNPYGKFSWATSILPVMNCEEDLQTMNAWVMDMLRSLKFKKTHRDDVGGLGYEVNKKIGVVTRGTGKTVTKSREKLPEIEGYKSLVKMQKALKTNRAAYNALVRM